MNYAKSCGIVVYKKIDDEYQFLIIKQQNGDWGMPKGHVEQGEEEIQTATRELLEETGLSPKIDKGFREVIHYFIPEKEEEKDVVFFLGEVQGETVILQEEELLDYKWKDKEQALKLLTRSASKEIIKKAYQFLKNR